jgi:hypothetical protein
MDSLFNTAAASTTAVTMTVIPHAWGDIFSLLNGSKIIMASLMLLMNVAGRYIDLDLHPDHKKFLASSTFVKRLFIFAIAFMATRDIILAIIITACYVIVVMHLLNPKSPYSLIASSQSILENQFAALDTNKDGVISRQEYYSKAMHLQSQ